MRNYYQNKVVSENLITAIYYHATMCRERGDGGQPEDPTYGLLNELEHRNLTTLYQNSKAATAFLFKGIKDEAPVGGATEDNVGVSISGAAVAEPAGGAAAGSSTMDMASLVASGKAKADGRNALEASVSKTSGGDKKKDAKKDTKEKSGAKTKSTSKGKGSS